MPADQVVCAAGTGGNPCTVCAAGSWSTGGTYANPGPECTPCGTGTTTAGTGAKAEGNCSGGFPVHAHATCCEATLYIRIFVRHVVVVNGLANCWASLRAPAEHACHPQSRLPCPAANPNCTTSCPPTPEMHARMRAHPFRPPPKTNPCLLPTHAPPIYTSLRRSLHGCRWVRALRPSKCMPHGCAHINLLHVCTCTCKLCSASSPLLVTKVNRQRRPRLRCLGSLWHASRIAYAAAPEWHAATSSKPPLHGNTQRASPPRPAGLAAVMLPRSNGPCCLDAPAAHAPWMHLPLTISKVTKVCENDARSIGCPSSMQIVVTSAKFGRRAGDVETCGSAAQCPQVDVLSNLTLLCNGLQTCLVRTPFSIWSSDIPDPCFGTPKYTDVQWRCELGEPRHPVTREAY